MEPLPKKQSGPHQRIYYETLVILVAVVILSFLFPHLKGIFELLPIAYFLIERPIRKRTYQEIGFKFRNTWNDVKRNWLLILFVAMILPFASLFLAKYFLPDYAAHVQSRLPLIPFNQIIPLLITITVGTFAEEMVFRGFFQERLGWYLGKSNSIIIASIIFSLMHFSPGTYMVVSFDLFTIFLDNLLYGFIYHRTQNIFASWLAHYLADLCGLAAFFLLF